MSTGWEAPSSKRTLTLTIGEPIRTPLRMASRNTFLRSLDKLLAQCSALEFINKLQAGLTIVGRAYFKSDICNNDPCHQSVFCTAHGGLMALVTASL